MLKTNSQRLVQIAVAGQVAFARSFGWEVAQDGRPFTLPSVGGIAYNVKIGDLASGFEADHVEPGVSIRRKDDKENAGLNTLACVGNVATVVSGDAKGAKGFVTGKHGGIEHVLVWFDQDTLEKLGPEDNIQIRSWGTGLALEELPDIKIKNLDPELLAKMDLQIKDGVLEVPVVTTVPAYLMGSGMGSATAHRGDYDIMTADPKAYKQFGLDRLRFGDLVLLQDCDTTYGRGYLEGAITVGVVVHSDCLLAGHGPGVTTLFTCKTPKIRGIKSEKANIGYWLGIL
jgi:hypothetical protein